MIRWVQTNESSWGNSSPSRSVIVSTDNFSDAADEASSRRQRLTGGDNLCSSEQFGAIRTNPLLSDCLLKLPMLFNLSTFLRPRLSHPQAKDDTMTFDFQFVCTPLVCLSPAVFVRGCPCKLMCPYSESTLILHIHVKCKDRKVLATFLNTKTFSQLQINSILPKNSI